MTIRQEVPTEKVIKCELELLEGGGNKTVAMSNSGNFQQIFAALIAALSIFITGMSVGWPSPVGPLLRSSNSPIGVSMTEEELSWLNSVTFLSSIFGTFFWGRLADIFGRKLTSYTVALPFIIGWSLTVFFSSKKALLFFRIFNGLSGSGAFILCPLYIGEIAHDSIRGTLSSFIALSFNGGIVFIYLCGALFSYEVLNLICLAAPFTFIFLFYWFPESPAWLSFNGKKKEAEAALMWYRGCNVKLVQAEIASYSHEKEDKVAVSFASLFNTRGRRTAMLIGCGLFAWQQFCGITVILTYTSKIFIEAESTLSPYKATVLVGIFQLAASLVSSLILQHTGRKLLLNISFVLMGLALTTIGFYFFFKTQGLNVHAYGWIPVAALCLHVCICALGAGPVPFVVLSEILHPEIRNLATSVLIFWSSIVVFTVVKIFPILEVSGGMHGALWFFAICCLMASIFTCTIIPETKGIPLQDVLKKLNGESLNPSEEESKHSKLSQLV